MHPICCRLGPLTIHWYGVMMALGFLVGLGNWILIGRGKQRDARFCSDMLFWIMLGGIVGGRLVYVLLDWSYYVRHPAAIVRIDQGGLVYYGGFLGAWLALSLFARKHRIAFFDLADFVVTSLPLAHAFGRIGCFMNGCCHGAPTQSALGVVFPARSGPWHEQIRQGLIEAHSQASLPVYPTQLFEVGFNLLLYGILIVVWRRRPWVGAVAVVYVLLYPIGRFLVEFLRGDARAHWLGFSVSQWISMGLFACGLGLYAFLSRRARRHA